MRVFRKNSDVPTEDAAIEELKDRLFVKVGTAETPNGDVPSINIGFDGNGKEKEATSAAATRVIKDVWKMIGVDPETGQALPRPDGGTPLSEDKPSAVPQF